MAEIKPAKRSEPTKRADASKKSDPKKSDPKKTDIAKGARITGPSRDKLGTDLRKKYEGGRSVRDLADSTGRSYGFVHRILVESGVDMRGRGGATRGKAAKTATGRASKKA